jgi:hypothetical protein
MSLFYLALYTLAAIGFLFLVGTVVVFGISYFLKIIDFDPS